MKESFDAIYNGPTRSGPLSTEAAASKNTGKFTAKQTPRGTHNHKWIFGHDNAVCTSCGYTLPKNQELPKRGIV